jgi:hypothetical protein
MVSPFLRHSPDTVIYESIRGGTSDIVKEFYDPPTISNILHCITQPWPGDSFHRFMNGHPLPSWVRTAAASTVLVVVAVSADYDPACKEMYFERTNNAAIARTPSIPLVIYNRIPKCGSTTLIGLFEKHRKHRPKGSKYV